MRRHDCALPLRDMSRWEKAVSCHRTPRMRGVPINGYRLCRLCLLAAIPIAEFSSSGPLIEPKFTVELTTQQPSNEGRSSSERRSPTRQGFNLARKRAGSENGAPHPLRAWSIVSNCAQMKGGREIVLQTVRLGGKSRGHPGELQPETNQGSDYGGQNRIRLSQQLQPGQ
jgi:hypothetical protein